MKIDLFNLNYFIKIKCRNKILMQYFFFWKQIVLVYCNAILTCKPLEHLTNALTLR